MRSEHMVGALDQQRPEVDIASLGDAELRVVVPGLAASRPQAEVTADIPTSLEAFLAAQRQNVRQCRELADAINLDQRLRVWVLRLRESLDGTVVLFDLYRHRSDLLENRAECLGQTWRQHGHATLGETQGGRRWQTVAAGFR